MKRKEVMQQALEALEICEQDGYIPVRLTRDAITALRKALEQPEQQAEPVLHKWAALFEDPNNDWQAGYESARRWVLEVGLQSIDTPPAAQPEQMADAVDALTEDGWIWDGDQWQRPPAAQPEQEPVAWMSDTGSVASLHEKEKGYVLKSAFDIPLYTTQPAAQPEREPIGWLDGDEPLAEFMRRAWNAALKHEAQPAAQPAQKDAARYQHIKGMARAMSLDMGGNHYWHMGLRDIRGPNLDEAIDRAIKAEGQA